MKISCPSCSAKYSIADEKVNNRLAKIRCRKCGSTIVIDGKVSPPSVQAVGMAVGGTQAHADAAGASDAPAALGGGRAHDDEPVVGLSGPPPGTNTYTVDVAADDQRTLTVDAIVEAYNGAVISADTFVWKDGMPDWARLGDIPELVEALHAAARQEAEKPAPAAAKPAQAPKPEPRPAREKVRSSPTATASLAATPGRKEGSSPRAAARLNTGTTDLFGGVDSVGSERDAGLGPIEASRATAGTGARNESSVLFSLSALTSGSSSASKSSSTKEDSGLIDLAALTASAARDSDGRESSPSLDMGPLGMPFGSAPLGGAPLIGGTTAPLGTDAQFTPPTTSRNGLFIGGGIAFAALVFAAAYVLKEEPPPASVASAALTSTALAPLVPASVETVAEAPAVPSSQEQGKTEASDDTKSGSSSSSSKSKWKSSKSTQKPSGESKSTSPPAAAEKKTEKTEPPKPKGDTCNCKPGDLMCAMRCSAKKKK